MLSHVSIDMQKYWPDEDEPNETHGLLTVELLSERYTTITNVVERELKVHLTAKVDNMYCAVCALF